MTALRAILRRLVRSPAFLVTAVASLAICFSANGALLGFLDALVLHPQPGIADPGSVVRVFQYQTGGELRYPTDDWFASLQALNPSSARLAYYAPALVDVSGVGPARHVVVDAVSPSYFTVLGARMSLGRTIAPADSNFPIGAAPAVMSWRYWKRELGGDSAVLGHVLRVNGNPAFRIVGVAAPGFVGTEGLMQADFWLLDTAEPGLSPFGRIVGRVANAAPAALAAELGVLSKRIAAHSTESADLYARKVGTRFQVEPLRGGLHPEFNAVFNRTIGAAFAVCLAVLLLTCVNVGGLLLIRTVNRRRDIAIRRALGAGRRRVVQEVLVEATLVCVAGGALGMALAPAAAGLLAHAMNIGATFDVRVPVDPLWSAGMMGAALITALVCGVVPALRASNLDPEAELRADAVASTGGRRLRMVQGVFVVAQVALALLIVSGATVATLKTWQHLHAPLGVQHEERALVTELPGSAFSPPPSNAEPIATRIERQLTTDSRVAAVGWAAVAPGEPSLPRMAMRAQDNTAKGNGPMTAVNPVGGQFLSAAGIPVIAGRGLDARDDSLAQRVVVLSRSLAARLYPRGTALGRSVVVGGNVKSPYLVVGAVGDVAYALDSRDPQPVAYLPASQLRLPMQSASLVVGTVVPASDAIRSSVDRIIRGAGVLASPSVTLRQIVAHQSSQERTVSLLLAYAAALCLLIAVIGTYGLTAFEVSGRQREIAVRIALGGTPAGVVMVFVARGAKLAALGLLSGAALGYAAQQLSGALPFGQPGTNPAAALAAAAIILVATTAGAVIAAFRRARLDPSVVLRSE